MTNYKPLDSTDGKYAPMDMVFWYRDNGFTLKKAIQDNFERFMKAETEKSRMFNTQVHNLLIDR